MHVYSNELIAYTCTFTHLSLSICLILPLSLSLSLSCSHSLSLFLSVPPSLSLAPSPLSPSPSISLSLTRTVIHGYQLCQGEQAISLTSCTLGESADTRNTFYVVGTAFVDVREKEPTQGRVLVSALSPRVQEVKLTACSP